MLYKRRWCVLVCASIICNADHVFHLDCYKCGEYDTDMKPEAECNVEGASYAQEECNNGGSCWVGPLHRMVSLFLLALDCIVDPVAG